MSEARNHYMNKRLEQVEARKEMVIEKSKELFLKKGLKNVTMNDIMQEVGIGKATMYRYFESIHPIAFQVQYQMMKEIYGDILIKKENLSSATNLMESVLVQIIDNYPKHIKAYSYISMFDHLYASSYPDEALSVEYDQVLDELLKEVIDFELDFDSKSEIMTYLGIISAYLQKLAIRKEVIDQSEIDVEVRISYLKKFIKKVL